MARTKLTERQIELVSLLPNNIRNSKDLLDTTKVLLGYFLFSNMSDSAKENGYIFEGYNRIYENTGIKSKTTISSAICKLDLLGFFSKKITGKYKGNSTKYWLNMDAINNYSDTETVSNNNWTSPINNCNSNNNDSNNNWTTPINNCNSEMIDILKEILLENRELRKEITEIRTILNNYSNNNWTSPINNCTIELDIDIEKDNKLNNDNIPDDIIPDDINKKEKINKKENKSVVSPTTNECRNTGINKFNNNDTEIEQPSVVQSEKSNNNNTGLNLPTGSLNKLKELSEKINAHIPTVDISSNTGENIKETNVIPTSESGTTGNNETNNPIPDGSYIPDEKTNLDIPTMNQGNNNYSNENFSNSAPAPAENAQKCPTIADQSSNDKEYQDAQENATEAKTEPQEGNMDNSGDNDNSKSAEIDEIRRLKIQKYLDAKDEFWSNVCDYTFNEMRSLFLDLFEGENVEYCNYIEDTYAKGYLGAKRSYELTVKEAEEARKKQLIFEEAQNRRKQWNNTEHSTMERLYC